MPYRPTSTAAVILIILDTFEDSHLTLTPLSALQMHKRSNSTQDMSSMDHGSSQLMKSASSLVMNSSILEGREDVSGGEYGQ